MRAILHVDMDAFFAAVEERDHPHLRGQPMVVGGRSRRGVVAAASYEARKFGVFSAMPMAEALQRCPGLVVVEPRRGRYEEVSRQIFDIFERFTPLVEGLSVDEAFLDVTESSSLFGNGESIARRIKHDIQKETGLTASAGVARCKFVAKVASDLDKPDGLVVAPEDEAAFLAPLLLDRMWGVGPKTAPLLREHGFRTLGDLARAEPSQLAALLGERGFRVSALSRAIDTREVTPIHDPKSVASESTFEEDLRTAEAIEAALLSHASEVSARLVAEGVYARTVGVKLRYYDFRIATRQCVLDEAACDAVSLHRAAKTLLGRFSRRAPVRLVGLFVKDLSDGPSPTLFPDAGRIRRTRVEETVNAVRMRLGAKVTYATLLRNVERK